jgi:hypothetical protein
MTYHKAFRDTVARAPGVVAGCVGLFVFTPASSLESISQGTKKKNLFETVPHRILQMPGLNLGDTVPDFDAETSVGPIKFHEWIGDRCVSPMDSTFLRCGKSSDRGTSCIATGNNAFGLVHSFLSFPFQLNGHVFKKLCDANPG